MQHLKTRLLFSLFGIISIGLFSQNTKRVMGLEDCVSYAIDNNAQVEKARLEIEKSEYRVKEYVSTALPSVNADLDIRWNIELPTQQLPGDFFCATERFEQIYRNGFQFLGRSAVKLIGGEHFRM